MKQAHLGLVFCFAFVTMEAFQAVYLGAVFQTVDAFLVGAWVFGISAFGCTAAAALRQISELTATYCEWRIVLCLNVLAALTWATYSISIQLIEPAVSFSVFSGMVPLGTRLAARIGMSEAVRSQNTGARLGDTVIALSLIGLAVVTVAGQSGFVRGNATAAFAGLAFAAASGLCTSFVILFSLRLNDKGVGPLMAFGVRFFLYAALAFVAAQIGLDSKAVNAGGAEIATVVFIGLVVIAFPLYLVQRAVPLVPPQTIAAITALGPVFVFAMQMFDHRVVFSGATMSGLMLYMVGALYSAGKTRAVD